ncbi:MAG TPA: HEAT repeat domain-containing protein [Tepidisphaeraceae bacterium]|nr:HEAT repeat domain-containing protein [Tepidisphaeraceae bacterium]
MAITFACGNCGKAYRVDDRFAGKKAACKACGTVNVIPAAAPDAAARAANAAIDIAPVKLRGAEGESSRAPSVRPPSTAPKGRAPVARTQSAPAPLDDYDASLDAAAALERPAEGAPCPGCGGALAPEAVFCTGCGYDLRKGKQIATKVVTTIGDAPANPWGGGTKASGRGSSSRGERGGASGLAGSFLVLGTVVWVLPIFGFQLKKLSAMGGYSPLAGAIFCGVAALLYFFQSRQVLAGVGGASMIAGFICFGTVGQDLIRQEEEIKSAVAENDLNSGRSPGGASFPSPSPPPSNWSSAGTGGSSGGSSPPAAPAIPTSDFHHEGRLKIELLSSGGGTFTNVNFKAMPVPPDQDPVEFYRPGLRQPNPLVREATIQTLMQLSTEKRPAAAAAVAELVGDPELRVRLAAVRAQESTRHDGTAAALTRALGDADSAVREVAIRAIARVPSEAAVDPLVNLFPRHAAAVRATLGAFVEAYKEKVAQAFANVAQKKDEPNRRLTMDTVWAMCKEHAGPALMHFVDEADAGVRADAIARLVELKHEPAAEVVARRLGHDGLPAVQAVAKFGPAGERAALARLADGSAESKCRVAAVAVLKLVGTKETSLEATKAAANDNDLAVAKAARELWRQFEPGALPPMDEAMLDLNSEKPERRAEALAALAKIKPDPAKQAEMAKRMYDLATTGDNAAVQAAARTALVVWANKEVRDATVQAIATGDEGVRKAAIWLAMELKEARAADAVCELLGKGVSPELVEALKRFGPPAEDGAVRLLISTNEPGVAAAACEVLGAVGTRKCVQTLGQVALKARAQHPQVALAAKQAREIVEKREKMR